MSELISFKSFVALEARVRRIEKHLHLDAPPIAPVAEQSAPVAPIAAHSAATETEEPMRVVAVEHDPVPPEYAVRHVGPPPLPTGTFHGQTVPLPVMDVDEAAAPTPSSPVIAYQPPKPFAAPRKDSHSNIEQWIGLNWTGWVGAIVLVVGAALGIKYAYDNGWFGGLPKEVRLGFCFAVGLSLLGVGEWIDRRVNRVTAACLFGAGIATLFVVSYAGFGYFELYNQSTAFVLMAVSTLIGAGVAMRKNLVSIAVLSMLGANLAPIILRTDHPRWEALLVYILALQVVSLVLAAWGRGGKWWILRGFAIAMPALWTGAVYVDSGLTTLPMIYSIIYALLVQAEMIVSTGKRHAITSQLAAITSVMVTSLLALSLMYALQAESRYVQGAAVLITAAACGGLAIVLRKFRPELSLSFRIQSAVLVLVSVPVMLEHEAVILVWGALSLVYAIVGRQIGSAWGRWFGAAAWTASLLYLLQWCNLDPKMMESIVFVGVPLYVVLAMSLTVIGHALARIIQRSDEAAGELSLAGVVDLLAGLSLFFAAIAGLETWTATASLIVYAWLLVLADRVFTRPTWSVQGGAALLLATLKWGAVDVLSDRFAPGYVAGKYLPVMNPVMGVGSVLAGSIVGMYVLQKEAFARATARMRIASPALWVATFVMLILLLGLSLDVDRAVDQLAGVGTPWPPMQLKQLGWSMLWSAAVAIHVTLVVKLCGEQVERRDWLAMARAVLMLVALKFLLLDVLIPWLSLRTVSVLPLVNVEVLAGVMVAAALGYVWWRCDREAMPWRVGGALMLAILLLCGTVEIDRAFERTRFALTYFDNARLAKQVAISIWWAGFAVACVIAGFRFRIAGLRYFGLALLAVALGKVVIVDLQEFGRGYRVLSFLGLGGLLLATSVVYGKLSPKLLGEKAIQAES